MPLTSIDINICKKKLQPVCCQQKVMNQYMKKQILNKLHIDDKIYVHEGVRILGLGGSMRYKPGEHQYTEWEMRRRVFKLFPKLVWRRGFDILVTHAPAYQLNDARDLPHQGFKIFLQLIEKYHPKFFLHGHVHMSYGRQHKRYDKYMDTYVINAFDRCVFEFETEDPEKDGQ